MDIERDVVYVYSCRCIVRKERESSTKIRILDIRFGPRFSPKVGCATVGVGRKGSDQCGGIRAVGCCKSAVCFAQDDIIETIFITRVSCLYSRLNPSNHSAIRQAQPKVVPIQRPRLFACC